MSCEPWYGRVLMCFATKCVGCVPEAGAVGMAVNRLTACTCIWDASGRRNATDLPQANMKRLDGNSTLVSASLCTFVDSHGRHL